MEQSFDAEYKCDGAKEKRMQSEIINPSSG